MTIHCVLQCKARSHSQPALGGGGERLQGASSRRRPPPGPLLKEACVQEQPEPGLHLPAAGGDSRAAASLPGSPSPGPQDTTLEPWPPDALGLLTGTASYRSLCLQPPPLPPACGPHCAFPMSMSPSLTSLFAPRSPDSPQPQHGSHPPFDAQPLCLPPGRCGLDPSPSSHLTLPAGAGPVGGLMRPQASGVPSGHPGMPLSPGFSPSQALV